MFFWYFFIFIVAFLLYNEKEYRSLLLYFFFNLNFNKYKLSVFYIIMIVISLFNPLVILKNKIVKSSSIDFDRNKIIKDTFLKYSVKSIISQYKKVFM